MQKRTIGVDSFVLECLQTLSSCVHILLERRKFLPGSAKGLDCELSSRCHFFDMSYLVGRLTLCGFVLPFVVSCVVSTTHIVAVSSSSFIATACV
jgi:hypothetical protein